MRKVFDNINRYDNPDPNPLVHIWLVGENVRYLKRDFRRP